MILSFYYAFVRISFGWRFLNNLFGKRGIVRKKRNRSSMSYFLFLRVSFSCMGFITVCEGRAPLVAPWDLPSAACAISFFPVCGRLLILTAVGVLLSHFGIVLFPLSWVCILALLVLSAKLLVVVDKPTLVLSLRLENCIIFILMVGFATGSYHCARQSLMIQSTSPLVTQYFIFSHTFLGSLVAWIHTWFLNSLNFSIPYVSYTTSIVMRHKFIVHCWIYSSSIAKIMLFSSCIFLSFSFQRDSYLAA